MSVRFGTKVGVVVAVLLGVLVGAPAGAMNDPDDDVELQQPAQPEPEAELVYEGTGTQVVPIELPDPMAAAVAVVTHEGEGNFIVWELDEGLDEIALPVNAIGDYAGTVPLNFSADSVTTALDVTADGRWRVEVRPLFSARLFGTDITGTGDDVLIFAGGAEIVAVTHEGDGNFIVWSHGGDTSDLAVNEIGPVEATVPIRGPSVLVVTANGPWSLAVA